MNRFYLMSDIHMDHIDDFSKEVGYLIPHYNREIPILLTGDVSIARDFRRHISEFAEIFTGPIYIVLGNHDYWGSSYIQMNAFVRDISVKNIHFCADQSYQIVDRTAIVMSNNWYSAKDADVYDRFTTMNDWNHVHDFARYGITGDIRDAIGAARMIAQRNADGVRPVFSKVCKRIEAGEVDRVVVMCHFPPFQEMMSQFDSHTPYYYDHYMGEEVSWYANAYSDIPFTVVSGHTHMWKSYFKNNISAFVAPANYGQVYMIPFKFDGERYVVDA